jgi:hypothetical protein
VFFSKSPPLRIIHRSLAYQLSMNAWKRQGVRLTLFFYTAHKLNITLWEFEIECINVSLLRAFWRKGSVGIRINVYRLHQNGEITHKIWQGK